MTKKHFRDLAAALYRARPRRSFECPDCGHSYDEWFAKVSGVCDSCGSRAVQNIPAFHELIALMDGWLRACHAVSFACSKHNDRYSSGRFLHACLTGEM